MMMMMMMMMVPIRRIIINLSAIIIWTRPDPLMIMTVIDDNNNSKYPAPVTPPCHLLIPSVTTAAADVAPRMIANRVGAGHGKRISTFSNLS